MQNVHLPTVIVVAIGVVIALVAYHLIFHR